MGSQISHESSMQSSADISGDDPRSPSANVTRTPLRKMIYLGDPRSPTINYTRTPIHITKRISKSNADTEAIQINTSKGEIDQWQPEDFCEDFDPRSPTTNFTRTPIHIAMPINKLKANRETIKFNMSKSDVDHDQQEESCDELDDPRSPAMNFARTPIHVTKRTSKSNTDVEPMKLMNISESAIQECQHDESCEISPDNPKEMGLTDASVSSEQPIQSDDQVQSVKLIEARSDEENINNNNTSAITSLTEDLVPTLSTLKLETGVIDNHLNDTSKPSTERSEVLAPLTNNKQTSKNTEENKKKCITKKIHNENIGVDKIFKGKIVHQKLANVGNIARSPLKDNQNSPFLNSNNKNQRRVYSRP